MTFGSLFAGVGGFDIGLERVGMRCAWQVELDPFCWSVLWERWPDVPKWDDVRTFPPDFSSEWKVDVLCGGFPCQDISPASHTGAGIDGERSGLWAEFARTIRVLRPRFVLVENSAAITVRGLDRVLGNLAECGYDAEWQAIQASDFALPHSRKRLFIVAYPDAKHGRQLSRVGPEPYRPPAVFTSHHQQCAPIHVQAADCFVGMDDGISGRAYESRACAIGNAVVPQVAEWIGRRIIESHNAISASTD